MYIRVLSLKCMSGKNTFSVRWQKNGHDYKYMNFGRKRFALKCPLYSHSSALAKMIKKKKLEDYMDRVEALAYDRTSTSGLQNPTLLEKNITCNQAYTY